MNTYQAFIQDIKELISHEISPDYITYRIIPINNEEKRLKIIKVTIRVYQIRYALGKLIRNHGTKEAIEILEKYFLCLKETHKNYPVAIRVSENCSLELTEKNALDLAIIIISKIEREILSRIAS